jgi:hypothetical protein
MARYANGSELVLYPEVLRVNGVGVKCLQRVELAVQHHVAAVFHRTSVDANFQMAEAGDASRRL